MNFRKIKNRLMSYLLILCMAMGFMPVQNVLAATTYTYQQLYDMMIRGGSILNKGDRIKYSDVTVGGYPTTDYDTEKVKVCYYGPKGEGGEIESQLITVPKDGTVTDLQIKELTHNGVVYNSWRLSQFSPSLGNVDLWLYAEGETNQITTSVNGGNGTITASKKTAKGGETVTFTVAPKEGYEFDFSSIVKKPAGLVINPVENRHNEYTFTMPNEPVEITGSFKKIGKYKINITGGTAWDAGYNEVTEAAAGEFINITPADWDTFDHWDADCTLNWKSTEPGNDFIMPNKDVNITAVSTGAETNHKVTVQNDGNGTASADLTTAKKGDTVKLTATPNKGYRFKEWQVISGGVKVANNEFTMPDGDVTVKAIFEEIPAPTYSVTVQNDGNGTASADLTTAKKGEKVKLTATPNKDYRFKEWQVISGGVSVTNNEFTMPDGDVTVKAIFEKIPTYSITVENDGNGSGSATPSTAKAGDKVTLTATPNKDYRFKEWQVVSGGITVNNNEFTMPDGDVTVKAIFEEIPTYTIIVENDGNGSGTATPSTAKAGDKVTLTATPNKDYRFKEWQVVSGGITVNKNEFTMPNEDVTVKAIFEKIPAGAHKVTVQNDGNGSGSATPSTAKAGDKVTLTATPNKDYRFKEWQVVSGGITVNNNEFTMPNKDVTVKAIFEKTEPINPQPTAPTITSGENGTHQIGTGKNLLFTFSEALNGLIGVYVDGKAVDPSNYMINMYNTALNLKSGYLDTLPAGKHTLLIRCADDISVSTEFTVKSKAASNTTGDNKTKTDVKKANTVQTGDTTNISLYLCLLSLSAIAIYIMAHLKKRKFW